LEGRERRGREREKGKRESRGEGREERKTKIAAAKSLIVCCWKEWRGWEREEEGKDCRSQEFDCLLLEGVEKKLNFFTKGERRGS